MQVVLGSWGQYPWPRWGTGWPLLGSFPMVLQATVVAATQQLAWVVMLTFVEARAEKASLFPFLSLFFFHLPAFITAIVRVVVLCFNLKIRCKSLLFAP